MKTTINGIDKRYWHESIIYDRYGNMIGGGYYKLSFIEYIPRLINNES